MSMGTRSATSWARSLRMVEVASCPRWQADRITSARVDMGSPILRAADVPVVPANAGRSGYAALDAALAEELGVAPGDLLFDAPIEVDGTSVTGTAVSMGNPHFVAFMD